MSWLEKIGAAAIVAAAAAALAFVLWAFYTVGQHPAAPVAVAVESAPAAAVSKVPLVTRAVPKGVRTYAPAAKVNLKLPPAVIANNGQQVVSATTVRSSERPQTVTSVLDVDTGEVNTYTKAEPMPWIDFRQRGEVRLAVGYKIDKWLGVPQRVGRLSVTHDFMQAKALNAGVAASIDTDGEAFVGVGIAYRW